MSDALLDPELADDVAVDVEAEDVARLLLGVVGAVGELHAAGLSAAAGQHLRLDDDLAAELLRGGSRLLGVVREPAVGTGIADALEQLLRPDTRTRSTACRRLRAYSGAELARVRAPDDLRFAGVCGIRVSDASDATSTAWTRSSPRPAEALQGRSGRRRRVLRRAGGRDLRPPRPERRRQVDDRAHARDADAARRRRGSSRADACAHPNRGAPLDRLRRAGLRPRLGGDRPREPLAAGPHHGMARKALHLQRRRAARARRPADAATASSRATPAA